MKHSIAIFLIAVFCSSSLLAQGIKYESSFENAKQLAILEKKPLAVLITIKPQSATADYMDGLKDVRVIKKFNSSFINFRIDMSDTAVALKIVREYRIKSFPAFLFLDSKGGFMFSDIAFLSKPEPLLFMADKAIAETKEKSLAEYDKEYDAGKNSPAFLKDYISRRIKAGIKSNGNLIETYIDQLKISDMNDYDHVLFILKAGPVIDSKAFKLAYLNKNIIDSIFKTEPLDVRVAINNAIIDNSMQRAISAKNSALAYSTANFARASWGNDFKEGQKKWSQKEIQYYFGIKDTARFLQHASFYYDQYYMSLTVDSVRRIDSLNYLAAKKRAEANAITTINGPSKSISYSFSYAKDSYATDLNNAAWTFYQMAGNNNEYLIKALIWSKRSIEYNPRPAYFDTYAHLLYRLKFFDEADSMFRKAIELGNAIKMDTKPIQEEYKKLKLRNL